MERPDRRAATMAAALPFTGLLESLRQHGVAAGARETELFYRLLARWEGESISELRDAIAALLGRDVHEVELIRRLFDALDAPVAPVPPPPPSRRRKWWWLPVVALALAAAGSVAWWWWHTRSIPDTPEMRPGDGKGQQRTETHGLPNPPPPPAPVTVRGRWWPATFDEGWWLYLLFAGAAASALSALAIWRRSERRAAALRTLRRDRLVVVPGPQSFQVGAPPYRGWAAEDLDDLATWLGRVVIEELPSRRLDIQRTVEASAARGRPVLLFAPRPPGHPLVILQDVGPEMDLWRRKVDALVDGLERRGTHVERWYFDSDARDIAQRPHGNRVPFSSLASRAEEIALLVVSTGMGILEEGRALAGWVRDLEPFPRRAWLHPIANRDFWRPSLARTPLPVFPMSRAGLAAAARTLGSNVPDAALKGEALSRPASRQDVEELRQLAALWPRARPELIMSLRERFLPHVPEEAILQMQEEMGAWGGGRFQWDGEARWTALRRLSRDHARRERETRRHLLDLMREQEPPGNSGAHLRWRLALVEQGAFLAERPDVVRIGGELAALATSGIGEEADDVLAALRETSIGLTDRTESDRRLLLRRAMKRAKRSTDAAVMDLVPRRGWLRAGDYARAFVFGALVAGIGLALRTPPRRTIPNVDNAYELTIRTTLANSYVTVERMNALASSQGALLQDGRPFADAKLEGALGPLPPKHWYQFRGVMPDEGWGLSNTVWVSFGESPTADLLGRIDTARIHPGLLELVKTMLEASRNAGADYWATSGYRSPEDQQALYEQGRTRPGAVVTNNPAYTSPHGFGLAVDFTRDADTTRPGLQPAFDASTYEELGKQAKAVGLEWGGDDDRKNPACVRVPGYSAWKKLKPLEEIWRQKHKDWNDLDRLHEVWKRVGTVP